VLIGTSPVVAAAMAAFLLFACHIAKLESSPHLSYFLPHLHSTSQYSKVIALLALVASTSAFAPATFGVRTSMKLYRDYGKYDDKMWDNDAKVEVYGAWNPTAPRSVFNFNPFETWEGNSPDASGIFPGETGYKDPQRGDISFAIMMVQRAESEARAAAPKPGSAPGCAGCRT
jgi:hypothetical protein